MALEAQVNDFIVGSLLRYFREGRRAEVSRPNTIRNRDLELLRLHWAVSPTVASLAGYMIANRHEMESWLGVQQMVDDAQIRGRILARETVRARAISGQSTRVVFDAPIRLYSKGANSLLLWTLQHALMLSRALERRGFRSSYSDEARRVSRLLQTVHRIDAVARGVRDSDFRARPSVAACRQAARSRRKAYRLAFDAYSSLVEIERDSESAIAKLLSSTLIAPLKPWQALELALGLAMGEALAKALGIPVTLEQIGPGTDNAIWGCGRFRIYWQSKTKHHAAPEKELSERLAERALRPYGLGPGDDRPDIVVVDTENQQVCALGEAKLFSDQQEGWKEATRAAIAQVVRYCRGYRSADEIGPLLHRSIVGLLIAPPEIAAIRHPEAPIVAGFEQFSGGGLEEWGRELTAAKQKAAG